MDNLSKARQQLTKSFLLCEKLEPKKDIDEELQAEILNALDHAMCVLDVAAWAKSNFLNLKTSN